MKGHAKTLCFMRFPAQGHAKTLCFMRFPAQGHAKTSCFARFPAHEHAKTLCFTRVFADRLGGGSVGGGRGRENPPPLVEGLNTTTKSADLCVFVKPVIFVYIREPFAFWPTFGEDFGFDVMFLLM